MKTPGQRQLITLQEQVKLGIVNVDEAVLHFKEWQLNQKKRSESFRFQQVPSSATVELFQDLTPPPTSHPQAMEAAAEAVMYITVTRWLNLRMLFECPCQWLCL